MAVEKRSTANLVQRSTANTNDRIVILSDPTANAQTATIAVGSLLNGSNLSITLTSNTPANSTALTVQQGTLLYDSNYLYVAVANNTLKRLGTLQTF